MELIFTEDGSRSRGASSLPLVATSKKAEYALRLRRTFRGITLPSGLNKPYHFSSDVPVYQFNDDYCSASFQIGAYILLFYLHLFFFLQVLL
jgi:hypothetical protein